MFDKKCKICKAEFDDIKLYNKHKNRKSCSRARKAPRIGGNRHKVVKSHVCQCGHATNRRPNLVRHLNSIRFKDNQNHKELIKNQRPASNEPRSIKKPKLDPQIPKEVPRHVD